MFSSVSTSSTSTFPFSWSVLSSTESKSLTHWSSSERKHGISPMSATFMRYGNICDGRLRASTHCADSLTSRLRRTELNDHLCRCSMMSEKTLRSSNIASVMSKRQSLCMKSSFHSTSYNQLTINWLCIDYLQIINFMIESIQTIFKCEHCRKAYQRKSFCVIHEVHCFKNPANKHICTHGSCVHLEVTEENLIGFDWYESSRKWKFFNCKKLQKSMYSYRMDRDTEICEMVRERCDMRMPIKCEHFLHIWADFWAFL